MTAVIIAGILLFFVVRKYITAPNGREQADVPEQVTEQPEREPEMVIVEDVSDNDQDRDGIPDEEESDLGTSKVDFDSDGDGLSDAAEINVWGTDPTVKDTDGDGFADGWEVYKGFNPNGSGELQN